MARQVANGLDGAPDATAVAVYVDGSFFSDEELPPFTRFEIYKMLRRRGTEVLMVESLSEFVTPERLREVAKALPGTQLVIGMGLQSSSETVRNLCVNTTETASGFLRANDLIAKFGHLTKAYVMVKPPFLSEEEGIVDAAESAKWIARYGVRDITLCPTRIVQGTVAYDLFCRGHFSPPRLESVVEVLVRLHREGVRARVSLINVTSSDMRSITPSGCLDCHERSIQGILTYNLQPETVDLSTLRCAQCASVRPSHDSWGTMTLRARVSSYLSEVGTSHGQKRSSVRASCVT